MKPLSVQLYTLRDFLKSPSDVAATLKRVKKIGYAAVELAGLGQTPAKDWAAILNGEGLLCSGAHISFEVMNTQTDLVIEQARLFNCSALAVPVFWGKSMAEFEKFATELNRAADRFVPARIRIGYHNHSHELVRFDRRTPLEMLCDKLSQSIWFELDTYWLVNGGADPIDWIRRCSGRAVCVHLKDMIIDADGKHHMAEVGEGNLNWKGILAATASSGTQWLVVEQDICQDDPFACLERSWHNLQTLTA